MNKEQTDQYYTNLIKFENGEWTLQQWQEYCTAVLEVIMEENKGLFIQLKDR